MPRHAVLKLVVNNGNLGLCDSRDYFTYSTDKLNFDYYGRKLFINRFFNSEILVCFSFIHEQLYGSSDVV